MRSSVPGWKTTLPRPSAFTPCRGNTTRTWKSTNMLERLMEEIKRRTLVVRIFPNAAACLRLVRALAAEIHEDWVEAIQYVNMDTLKDQKKEALRMLGDVA